ncbi:putative mechanosensitive ion channel [Haloferax mucosum ATCC BAA-1512]|uniref:Putative mechanosensitive ion channel n=1 Tax=Haloferax mucosum ATCC BAA-1512 TaxID=662479 RepID=M0IGE8_9EURY|nr:mechanosensitive ion channel family protein [Haloferax mucosum]ELZ94923.1 putative mechanosensitive ion channel [Haloferax mucosum ATCC BAA-1512]
MLSLRQRFVATVGQIDVSRLATYEDAAGMVVGFVVGAALVYLFGRLVFVPGVTSVVSARNENNPTLETATRTYTHAFVVVVATLVGVVGAGFGSLLTDTTLIVAALTLVVGVAGQEVIGALVSGFFLVADPDFNVGDWISWPGGEGVVEAVDFRVTRVRTVNNETISVPNTELTTNALVRPYGRERYRVTERIDVAYADDVELALRELAEVAREDERVVEDPAPTSRIIEFAGGSVGLKAEFWIESPMDVNLVDVRSQFRRRVKLRFDEEGLTLGPAAGREVSGRLDVDLVAE